MKENIIGYVQGKQKGKEILKTSYNKTLKNHTENQYNKELVLWGKINLLNFQIADEYIKNKGVCAHKPTHSHTPTHRVTHIWILIMKSGSKIQII